MSTAVLGVPFTFQALFLNAEGSPVVVSSPTASVFRYNSVGSRIVLTSGSMSAVAGVPGRYTLTWTPPTTLSVGGMLYVSMTGTDPETERTLRVEESVTLLSPYTDTGVIVRFF